MNGGREDHWEFSQVALIDGAGAKAVEADMIPVNEPLLDGNEKKYLVECIETGWISSEGPSIRRRNRVRGACAAGRRNAPTARPRSKWPWPP